MGKLGVIGGTGLYDLPGVAEGEPLLFETPFGMPSDALRLGRLGATEVVFLARHGPGHSYSPTNLPYRANIYAMKELGVSHLLALSAVGSLRAELPPRSLVLPDQIIDRTLQRDRTFFDGRVVAHVGVADPFCPSLRDAVADAADTADRTLHRGGTYVCIEGPQFSTRAESILYRSWAATVIGMTVMPEARLAREAELCYATLAMVTDFDVWHDEEEDVSGEVVRLHLRANAAAGLEIVGALAEAGLPERTCGCADALRHAIATEFDHVTNDDRVRLGLIGARYIPDSAAGAV